MNLCHSYLTILDSLNRKNMEFKYSNIENPETCDLEVLKSEIERLTNLSAFYDSKQLAVKKFINSVYGACASKFFEAHNINVAEAITLQGQHLNHFTENSINRYFREIFKNDVELHKKLGITKEQASKVKISGGKLTENKPLTSKEFDYLEGDESMVVAGDTDSVSGNSIVYLNGERIPISEAFDRILKNSKRIKDEKDNLVIKPNEEIETYGFDPIGKTVKKGKINYMMRHKVSKPRWRIKTASGKAIEVTDDHSIIVKRNDQIIEIRPSEINIKTDKIISLA